MFRKLKMAMLAFTATLGAIGLLAQPAFAARTIDLTGPGFFYVDPANGSDASNTCMVQASPCQTVGHALYVVQQDVDCQGYAPYIVIAPGSTVNESIMVAGTLVGRDQVFIISDASHYQDLSQQNPDGATWEVPAGTSGIQARDNGIVTVAGIHFVAAGTGSVALNPSQFGTIDFIQDDFGSFPSGWQLRIDAQGAMNSLGNYTISGCPSGGGDHILLGPLAKIVQQGGATVNVTVACTSYAFMQVIGPGVPSWGPNVTYTGPGAGHGWTGASVITDGYAYLSLSGNTLPGE